jgi:hypothetical protein
MCGVLRRCLACGMQEIALRTPGFAGADLANLLNEAAILAGRKSLPAVRNQEIDEAVDRWVPVVDGLPDNNRTGTSCAVGCHCLISILRSAARGVATCYVVLPAQSSSVSCVWGV